MTFNLSTFFKYHKANWLLIITLNIATSLTFAIADPLAMRYLIDDGLLKRNLDFFLAVIAIIIILSISVRSIRYQENILKQRLRNILTYNLSQNLLRKFYKQSYQKIMAHHPAYYTTRIYDEPEACAQKLVTLVCQAIEQLLIFSAAFSIAIWLSLKTTIILVLIVPFLYGFSRYFGRNIKFHAGAEREHRAITRDYVTHATAAYKTVVLFNLQENSLLSTCKALNDYLISLFHRTRSTLRFETLSNISLSFAESTVLIVASYEVIKGNLSIGGLMAYLSVYWKAARSITAMIEQYPEWAQWQTHIKRLNALIDTYVHSEKTNELSIDQVFCSNNLKFCYDKKIILNNISLAISKREKLLITGKNGSGKSTLAHILSGFLGENTSSISQEKISAMLYPLCFFKASLEQHLPLYSLRPTWLQHLLHDFKLDNKLAMDPSLFSEGEKRKAYILLTLLKPADFYIFDEPLTAIDTASKTMIIHWILTCTQNKALAIILHGDEQFYHHFDKVLEINEPFE